ncbi:hypothetical protein BJ322DRAFT_737526 [Thelephora terrestris]|uniref:Protein kinase domain-containing protein n=1 Tax=Thelephora terrestris TaxID=56493 RepID=A0A9P6HER0_9AGAM|nr:hypothetical protein BJ322DRAFT_737526 [Thelephora terrestris]
MTESLSLGDAEKRINEIAEVLANATRTPGSGPKGEDIIALHKLCGKYHTVPAAYKLEHVIKEGSKPQSISRVTEIWKGGHKGEEVAVKILRVSLDNPEVQRTKSRFCQEVVLMKQIDHDNILPFYGVSTTVSEFCLVFPWYENGDITKFLKANLGTNRYELLSTFWLT